MTNKIHSLAALVGAACLACAGVAQAQSAGTLVARVGMTSIQPQVDSGNLSAPSLVGTKLDVKNASQATAGVSYFWTDNIAFDLPVGLPFEHDLVGAGAINGVGKLGSTKALPVTLLAQYHLGKSDSRIRPYVGAGATYARLYDSEATAVLSGITGGTPARPTTLTMKSGWGATVELGVNVKVSGPWSVNASAKNTFLKTTGRLSTGQTIDVKLDPLSYSLAVAYQF